MKRFTYVFVIVLLGISLILALASCADACKTCHDKAEIDCSDCGGEAEVECVLCYGSGMRPCTLCNGTGGRTCYSCGGLGGTYAYDFLTGGLVYKPCFACVAGRVSCVTGSPCACIDGKTDCGTCTATGKVDCPDC